MVFREMQTIYEDTMLGIEEGRRRKKKKKSILLDEDLCLGKCTLKVHKLEQGGQHISHTYLYNVVTFTDAY